MIKLRDISDHPNLIQPLKELLMLYGHYMYDELHLIAGKEIFYKDLNDVPGKYIYPDGTFILALTDDIIAGCAGIKRFSATTCEMKRMFILPEYRGLGIGKALCTHVISKAREMQFQKILLDTNMEMTAAVQLYLKCGFKKIPPYCINENDHPVYMQYIIHGN